MQAVLWFLDREDISDPRLERKHTEREHEHTPVRDLYGFIPDLFPPAILQDHSMHPRGDRIRLDVDV